ncbi:hypothetical protein NL676_005269 [Syzygium grande]|nr:hypothetical protein NL676_005269 [Syzygium grande]
MMKEGRKLWWWWRCFGTDCSGGGAWRGISCLGEPVLRIRITAERRHLRSSSSAKTMTRSNASRPCRGRPTSPPVSKRTATHYQARGEIRAAPRRSRLIRKSQPTSTRLVGGRQGLPEVLSLETTATGLIWVAGKP